MCYFIKDYTLVFLSGFNAFCERLSYSNLFINRRQGKRIKCSPHHLYINQGHKTFKVLLIFLVNEKRSLMSVLWRWLPRLSSLQI